MRKKWLQAEICMTCMLYYCLWVLVQQEAGVNVSTHGGGSHYAEFKRQVSAEGGKVSTPRGDSTNHHHFHHVLKVSGANKSHSLTVYIPSKHAGSDLHLFRISWEALARSGPDDCCTPACFRTGSVWPKPGTISQN